MDTHSKTNAEFRIKVNEAFARHDNRVNDTLQGVMAELQAMRINPSNHTPDKEVNPFAAGDNFHERPSASTTPIFDRNHTNLKLNFPTNASEGEDPIVWIFKAEQYFEFKNIDASQQVQLTSFHLSNVALQWYH